MSDRSSYTWERVSLFAHLQNRNSVIYRDLEITYIEICEIVEMKKTINKAKEERKLESRELHLFRGYYVSGMLFTLSLYTKIL